METKKVPKNASIYKPSCTPGARLPHAWIKPLPPKLIQLPAIDSSYVPELSAEEMQAKRLSTLDLCPFDTFTLFADKPSASHWDRCVQDLQASDLLPSSLKIQVVAQGRDFNVQPGVNDEKWIEMMGLRRGQATLVRPDQRILACLGHEAGRSHIFQALCEYFGWERLLV